MATTIKFTKMQGAGNDYIYINTLEYPIADPVNLHQMELLSHGNRFRRTGIDWKISPSGFQYAHIQCRWF